MRTRFALIALVAFGGLAVPWAMDPVRAEGDLVDRYTRPPTPEATASRKVGAVIHLRKGRGSYPAPQGGGA